MADNQTLPRFQAAVERPLSIIFRRPQGGLEGHDYRVEVIAERSGLDGFDVVMDFRDLETTMDAALTPLEGQVLDLDGPSDLAQRLAAALASSVPEPAHLAEVILTDGRGRRIAYRL